MLHKKLLKINSLRLNLLKLSEMHNFEHARFMFKFYNKQLSKLFDKIFLKVSDSHNYSTRYAKKCSVCFTQSF